MWGDSNVEFRGNSASGGRIVLLPSAFWVHNASKMATFSASLLLCILQCFTAEKGMLPPGACRTSRQRHTPRRAPLAPNPLQAEKNPH